MFFGLGLADMPSPHKTSLIIPKPSHMDTKEYQKKIKQIVKLLEALDVKVIARDYEWNK